jgi:hypothetical protein
VDNNDKPYITLEDGTNASPGDVVYDYYDMQVVRLPSEGIWYDRLIRDIAEAGNGSTTEVWVHLETWRPVRDGNEGEMEFCQGGAYLNGTRMCSLNYAIRRKFRGAKEYLAEHG